MIEGCQILDFDLRYLYVNEAAARQGSTTREKLLGHASSTLGPGVEQSSLYPQIVRCLHDRTPRQLNPSLCFPMARLPSLT